MLSIRSINYNKCMFDLLDYNLKGFKFLESIFIMYITALYDIITSVSFHPPTA